MSNVDNACASYLEVVPASPLTSNRGEVVKWWTFNLKVAGGLRPSLCGCVVAFCSTLSLFTQEANPAMD